MVDGEAATVYDLDTHSPQQSDPVPNVAPLSTSDPWLLDIKEVLPPPFLLAPPLSFVPQPHPGAWCGSGARQRGRGAYICCNAQWRGVPYTSDVMTRAVGRGNHASAACFTDAPWCLGDHTFAGGMERQHPCCIHGPYGPPYISHSQKFSFISCRITCLCTMPCVCTCVKHVI